jgi:hypothetical protein
LERLVSAWELQVCRRCMATASTLLRFCSARDGRQPNLGRTPSSSAPTSSLAMAVPRRLSLPHACRRQSAQASPRRLASRHHPVTTLQQASQSSPPVSALLCTRDPWLPDAPKLQGLDSFSKQALAEARSTQHCHQLGGRSCLLIYISPTF